MPAKHRLGDLELNILSDGTQEISKDTGSWAYTVHVYAPPS